MGPAIALAAVAGVCNAVGDLLQRSSARHERSDPRESVRLLGRLLGRPRWVLGVVASLVGLAVHTTALSVGELTVVQPVLVIELPLAVLGSAWFLGGTLSRNDWVAVAALAAGLAMFVAFLSPTGGARLAVPAVVWVVGVTAVLVVVALLAVAGWRAGHDLRGGLLATAGGVGYGLTGIFLATAGEAAGVGGVPAVVGTWQSWAAIGSGAVSFYLLQNALAAGRMVAVEPGITLANPLVAVAWGVFVFGERVRGGITLLGAGLGGALIVVGVVLLARSPVLSSHRPDDRVGAGR